MLKITISMRLKIMKMYFDRRKLSINSKLYQNVMRIEMKVKINQKELKKIKQKTIRMLWKMLV